MRTISLFLLFVTATAQQSVSLHINNFSLTATCNNEEQIIEGTVSVWLQAVVDSISTISFAAPINMEIKAVDDIDDDSFSDQSVFQKKEHTIYTIELPSFLRTGDSIFMKIDFEEPVDSLSISKIFFNSQEMILPHTPSYSWLPDFGIAKAQNSIVDITVPYSYHWISSAVAETVQTDEGEYRWQFHYDSATVLLEALSLCGSVSLTHYGVMSEDSSMQISLAASPERFNQQLADSLLAQLLDASRYFKQVRGADTAFRSITFTILGDDPFRNDPVIAGNNFIFRHSPVFSRYDSSFTNSIDNTVFLNTLAHIFRLPIEDSTVLFNEGWAGYLSHRYLFDKADDPVVEKQARLNLMINALTFYPVKSLEAGTTPERNILAARGIFFFLMLEYVIGRETMDTAIKKIFERGADAPLHRNSFQSLCEQEYGSALDWFFQEWLTRTSIPEVVLQWKLEHSLRGSAQITVTIEQRGDIFSLPLNLYFTAGVKTIIKRIFIDQGKQEYLFQFPIPPSCVDIDSMYNILRWLLDIRILEHARASEQFLAYSGNVSSSKHEAQLALQLDPVNATGTAPLAYYSLGKSSAIEKDFAKAKNYFFMSIQSSTIPETEQYRLLSMVRIGNILEMEEKREEALSYYKRALLQAEKNTILYAGVIIEAEKYLRQNFLNNNELWFELN